MGSRQATNKSWSQGGEVAKTQKMTDKKHRRHFVMGEQLQG